MPQTVDDSLTFLSILRCTCGRDLRFSAAENQPLPGGTFGVLDCGTHTYPVIDSIPVIRHGTVPVQDHCTGLEQVAGPSVEELVDQIAAGRCLEALVSLLSFPPALPLGLERVPILRLPLTRGPGHRMHLARRRKAIERRLRQPLHEQTAEEWLRLFYEQSRLIDRELVNYFLLRFSMPRYPAALSLVTLLPASPKPVLDLACGFGHLMHHIGLNGTGRAAVGADRNFFQLWVARRWVAPEGHYVCADADDRLPFVDGAFSAVVCSDSFHLFQNMAGCLAELRRTASGGTIALICFGNRLMEPYEGFELAPTEYAEMVGDADYRLIGMSELVDTYRRRRGPALARQRDPHSVDGEKWLCLVIADDQAIFADHPEFRSWPHGEGTLGVNPIYRQRKSPDGVDLSFEFPSKWYAFENGPMTDYHAGQASLDNEVLEELRRGERSDRVQQLIDHWVILGLPERYLHHPVPG